MGASFLGMYHPRNIAHLRKVGVDRIVFHENDPEFAMTIIPKEMLKALPNGIKVRHHAVSKYAEFLAIPAAERKD